MFQFFYPTKDIFFTESFDFYPLLSLCEEYQLDWLKEKIIRYIISSFDDMMDPSGVFLARNEGTLIIYLLYLAEQFGIKQLKTKCYKYKFQIPLEEIMEINSLKLLSKESKITIYKYYLQKQFIGNKSSCKCNQLQSQYESMQPFSFGVSAVKSKNVRAQPQVISPFTTSTSVTNCSLEADVMAQCEFCVTNLNLINMIHKFTDDASSSTNE